MRDLEMARNFNWENNGSFFGAIENEVLKGDARRSAFGYNRYQLAGPFIRLENRVGRNPKLLDDRCKSGL